MARAPDTCTCEVVGKGYQTAGGNWVRQQGHDILYCPMHAKAPEMLKELQRLSRWSEDTDRYSTETLEKMVAAAARQARALVREITRS